MEYPYVIIDNDTQAIETVQLAMEHYENFICVGVEEEEQSGLDLILERLPSLVFLNIEMPGTQMEKTVYYLINELRKYIDALPEFIVFAHSERYAIEGIRNDVLDYIVKPSSNGMLRRALMRFQKKVVQQDHNSTLCLKSYGDYKFINTKEVLYLKADNNTTDIIRTNGTKISAFKTLKYFQESLPKHFIRIHNSYIVNSHFISRIHFGKSKCMIKNGDVSVPFSKSYRNNVEKIKNDLAQQSVVIV